MRFTFHGPSPNPYASPAYVELEAQHVIINLGFFRIKGIPEDSAKKHLMEQCKKENSRTWKSWEKSAEQPKSPSRCGIEHSQLPQKTEARAQLDYWMKKYPSDTPMRVLDFSLLSLISLPENLPDQIADISAYRNQLKGLPKKLPAELKELDASNNDMTHLPDRLPLALRRLNVTFNKLEQLPDNWRGSHLTVLNVSHNKLTSLPDNLPAGLTTIFADCNQITKLPESLPKGLTYLNISFNKLTSLPNNLPAGLTEICADFNQITKLPESLPSNVTSLDVGYNKLTSLPTNLPAGLTKINVEFNQITHIPDGIFFSDNTTTRRDFNFVQNPLSDEVKKHIRETMQKYKNLHITFEYQPQQTNLDYGGGGDGGGGGGCGGGGCGGC